MTLPKELENACNSALSCDYIIQRCCAGWKIERIDPLRFLAGCRKRRLNQALSFLSLSLVFEHVCCAVNYGPFLRCVIF